MFEHMPCNGVICVLAHGPDGSVNDFTVTKINAFLMKSLRVNANRIIGVPASKYLPNHELHTWIERFDTVKQREEIAHYEELSEPLHKRCAITVCSFQRDACVVMFVINESTNHPSPTDS